MFGDFLQIEFQILFISSTNWLSSTGSFWFARNCEIGSTPVFCKNWKFIEFKKLYRKTSEYRGTYQRLTFNWINNVNTDWIINIGTDSCNRYITWTSCIRQIVWLVKDSASLSAVFVVETKFAQISWFWSWFSFALDSLDLLRVARMVLVVVTFFKSDFLSEILIHWSECRSCFSRHWDKNSYRSRISGLNGHKLRNLVWWFRL